MPINVTLLFSREQYVAAAEAYLRGIERRIEAGLNPNVGSVASVFVSRWDVAVAGKVPATLRNQTRHRHRQAHLQGVPRAARLTALAADLQRRRASAAPAVGQHRNQGSEGLRRPLRQGAGRAFTVNTMPEGTLKALADHGGSERDHVGRRRRLRSGAGPVRQGRHRHRRLAARLQDEGAKSFVNSWNELMGVIASKSATLAKARGRAWNEK